MAENLKDYISVSDYAAFIGRTTAQVYYLINEGAVPCVRFQRGKMNGWLILKPANFDEWKSKEDKTKQ